MRIAMVGRYYNRQGGVSRCLAELSDRAARQDDVTVFAHEVLDRRDSTARFVRVPMLTRPRSLQTESFAVALSRGVRAGRFDLVHAHNPQALRADVYTAHSCHRAYIEMRRREGGLRGSLSRVYPPHVLDLAFERYCYRDSPALIVALTPTVKHELESLLGVDPSRIRVIPNGVDTAAFRPPSSKVDARHAVRGIVGELPDDAVALLFSGYEFHRKGLAQLLEALARLGDPRLRLWVAGGAERAPYLRQAEGLGVAERVRFLGHQADLAPLYQAADAFVMPTSYEPFGLVLIEALACGTPVITSRIAGMAGFMTDGAEGFLLEDPHDAGELAAALAAFVAARERWPEMQAGARALAEGLDWDEIWDRTRELYEEVLATKAERLARRPARALP
jgi:UDP-glucose:(heptosyl)LPS alpha-1,3-glucosyltransferase